MAQVGERVVALKQELEWLERNTVGVPGERAAALESWLNVRSYLAALEKAMRAMVVLAAIALGVGCAELEDGGEETSTIEPVSRTLRLPLVDGDEPIDCANTRGVATQVWATDGTTSLKLWYSGCEDGVVTVSRPGARWTHLRIEVLADGASWDACPGLVELSPDDDELAFDVGCAAD